MIRAAVLTAALVLAGCGKTPDPAATASARDIAAGMQKAVDDTDDARREATTAAPRPVTPQPKA